MCVAARELVCDMSLCAVVSHDLESDREPRSLLPFLYQCMREYSIMSIVVWHRRAVSAVSSAVSIIYKRGDASFSEGEPCAPKPLADAA